MKIYTKKGDAGETSLFGGTRVPKDDLRIRTYGTMDELNALLGMALCEPLSQTLRDSVSRVQAELFQLGAELATPRGRKLTTAPIEVSHVEAMEREIDAMEAKLPPLQNFILPGGCQGSAVLHLARTVSRRAERELATLTRQEPQRAEVLQYMNRLSDWLFVCARFANFEAQVADIPWNPPMSPKRVP